MRGKNERMDARRNIQAYEEPQITDTVTSNIKKVHSRSKIRIVKKMCAK